MAGNHTMSEKIGKWVGILLIFPLMFLGYVAYKIVIKGMIAYGLIKLGLDPVWAGIAALIIGLAVLAAIAHLLTPLGNKILAWADEDDPESGSNKLLEKHKKK
jgi:hypothetical protein